MMMLSEVARAVGVPFNGTDQRIRGVSTDTRTLLRGELFVALVGEHFDGHQFIAAAQRRGAVAAVVSAGIDTDLPLLTVPDTLRALGLLAGDWRQRFPVPVIAVTGSNGKTTVKEMLAAIFRSRGEGVVTRGNFNNEVGVPLTLFRLNQHHRYAVVEMGASRGGEIARLSEYARPTVALINNVASAHLEGFGTVADVAAAKGEIFQGLTEDGTAVINLDDEFAGFWRQRLAGRRVMTFALDARSADVSVDRQQVVTTLTESGFETTFPLAIDGQVYPITLGLPGLHNVRNAAAAAAAAAAAGIEPPEIARGLTNMRSVSGRLQTRPAIAGGRLIDDSYNANPGSVKAAVDVLAAVSRPTLIVLGEMAELGTEAERWHREIGEYIAARGIDQVMAHGRFAGAVVAGFGAGGRAFSSKGELIKAARRWLQERQGHGAVILVKGSRSSQMEEVVDALTGSNAADGLPGGQGPRPVRG